MVSLVRAVSIATMLMGLIALTPASPAQAAGVVGTGNADSCTEAALDAALSGGGLVTFNCGGPATIGLTSEKIIAANTSINGGGLITLDGQDQTRHFWVLDGIDLELTGMTLTGGNGIGADSPGRGGAIFTIFGNITVNGSNISGNSASISGGAIRVVSGTVTISDSAINDNSASRGGAIRSSSVGRVTINNSTLNGNSATGTDGGAIHESTSFVTIQNSTLNENTATGSGGAIRAGRSLTITGSTLNDNTSGSIGGAIRIVGGTLAMTDSTVSNNQADTRGGGIDAAGGSTVTINRSTLSGNETNILGGGVAIVDGTLAITNSTLSGNTANDFGGGFDAQNTPTSIVSSTLTDNSANAGGSISGARGTINVANTIIANSPTGNNCDLGIAGVINSQDYNLSDDDSCDLDQPNDLPNTLAGLAPLGSYGGPTQTHHPLNGSDAIDSANCVNSADQRGVARPQGADCDRGSVEVREPLDLSVLCVDRYTGQVLSPPRGQCAGTQVRIDLPSPRTLSFCISRYTGEISFSFGRPCSSNHIAHVIPGDGDLLACQSRYTGALRAIASAEGCAFDTETPVRISEPAP